MIDPTQEYLDLTTKAEIEKDRERREAAELIRLQNNSESWEQQFQRTLNYYDLLNNQKPWRSDNLQSLADLALLPIERPSLQRRLWRAICRVVKS